ncbi:M90 family metallopeptidase [Noviherbaspirillum galbum]|uniref:Zinc-dependent peptidase n=1 Tax=Noviherbaspirillum galbum TaxID=2709383 RepID=A0A6B3ST36_9BURK|nr:M90 family metallopeptidase [Noviherbaspirillum galbum]NEX61996.1 zinc-dependent peptidase [Noviherbaspirillum galbum]
MQWIKRLFGKEAPRIPDALWQFCFQQLPFLEPLSAGERIRLKAMSEDFLARKSFTGTAGFELDDETAVLIAAQACLPVLELSLDLYDDIAGVVVYPGSFLIPQTEVDEAGVVHEWQEPASGEAVHAGGAVVLSWEDATDMDAPGYNVVIHEFVHKIDMRDGNANGCPPFLPEFHAGIRPSHWQAVFAAAYEDFMSWVDELEAQLPEDFDDSRPDHAERYDELFGVLPMDPYAVRHPAEFFAVAAEAFFVLPAPLQEDYPEVYELLRLYFRQDPLGRA